MMRGTLLSRLRSGILGGGASPLLVALLAFGLPGTGIMWTPAAEAAPAPGALSVVSVPAGAAVYVDGQLQGHAPLDLGAVAPGDHRVKVVKDGYLENSRLLNVRSGQSEAVNVTLTPDTGSTRYNLLQYEEGGGGGGSKAVLVVLGLAAAGAGAYLLLRDTNEAPVAGSVTATPPIALASGTNVSFTAQGASDPDGDPLTYSWDFGDGATGSGQTTSHTYADAGNYNVVVTVSDSKLSATASGSVTVKDLAADWIGTWTDGAFSEAIGFRLTQSGGSLGGFFVHESGLTGSATGQVGHPRHVEVTVSIPGLSPFTFNGDTDANIDTISGNVLGSIQFTVRRQ